MYLWKYPLESVLERFAYSKFKGIEIMTTPPHVSALDMTIQEKRRLRELVDSYGFHVVALTPTFGDLNIASPRNTIRRETVREMRAQVDLAVDLGAPIVVLSPGKRPNPRCLASPPIDSIREFAASGIVECARYADDRGVTIGLEPGPSFFVETSDQLKELTKHLGVDSLKAVYDTSNLSVKESPVSAVLAMADLMCHVHLADNDLKFPDKLPIGMGRIDFRAIAIALNKVNFKGWSTIEFWYPENPDTGLLESKRRLESLGWVA